VSRTLFTGSFRVCVRANVMWLAGELLAQENKTTGEQDKMIGSKKAVIGVYCTPQGIERAGDSLVTCGFSDSDISVLLPEELDSDANRASFVLSVSCDTTDQVERAKEILERTMAQDLSGTLPSEPAGSAETAPDGSTTERIN
jgi:hypothetical protein